MGEVSHRSLVVAVRLRRAVVAAARHQADGIPQRGGVAETGQHLPRWCPTPLAQVSVPSIDSTSARLPPLPCSDNLFARVKRFVFNRWSDLATQTWPTHPWLVGRLPLRFPAHAIRLWSFDPQPLPAPAQPDRRVHRGPEPRRTGRGAHVPPASARTGLPSGPGCAEFTFRVLAPSRPDGRCVLGARSIMPQPPAPAFRVVKTVA